MKTKHKKQETIVCALRLPKGLHRQIVASARKDKRKMASYLFQLIVKAYKD
jgi:hypothetical protein